jgi:hypothetical protein
MKTPPRPRQKCHSELNYRLLVANATDRAPEGQPDDAAAQGEGWLVLPDTADGQQQHWSVLLNPDDAVRIRTDTADGPGTPGGPFSELSVGRCRAVLIAPGVRAKVLPAHPSARLLHIFPE